MEKNNLFSTYQTSFRKNRSINDQLVRLETFIRNGFIRKQVVAVFVDLEKAYDTALRYGMMKDLHNIGSRGHLTDFILFVFKRSFLKFALALHYRISVIKNKVSHKDVFCQQLYLILKETTSLSVKTMI